MHTKRLHARLAYVMRVDNYASVAYAGPARVDAHQVHPATIERNPKA
jgi:hypothetical protein